MHDHIEVIPIPTLLETDYDVVRLVVGNHHTFAISEEEGKENTFYQRTLFWGRNSPGLTKLFEPVVTKPTLLSNLDRHNFKHLSTSDTFAMAVKPLVHIDITKEHHPTMEDPEDQHPFSATLKGIGIGEDIYTLFDQINVLSILHEFDMPYVTSSQPFPRV